MKAFLIFFIAAFTAAYPGHAQTLGDKARGELLTPMNTEINKEATATVTTEKARLTQPLLSTTILTISLSIEKFSVAGQAPITELPSYDLKDLDATTMLGIQFNWHPNSSQWGAYTQLGYAQQDITLHMPTTRSKRAKLHSALLGAGAEYTHSLLPSTELTAQAGIAAINYVHVAEVSLANFAVSTPLASMGLNLSQKLGQFKAFVAYQYRTPLEPEVVQSESHNLSVGAGVTFR